METATKHSTKQSPKKQAPIKDAAMKTAGPLRRLIALVYDLLLLLGVSFGYGVIITLIRKLAGDDTMEPLQGLSAWLELTGLALCYCGYYCLCWLKKGQTLAMKAWRMELQMRDGGAPTRQACFYRCLLAPLCILAGGIGYWWCWFDRNSDSLQDRLTGTRVILQPKNRS